MEMRTEAWNGYQIRFVFKDGEWWGVAKDVADALGYTQTQAMTKHMNNKYFMSSRLDGMNMKSTLVNELGIYKAIMRSQRPEAELFEDWVYQMIQELRKKSGLDGFAVFRMMDKEHQKQMMVQVNQIKDVNPKHYIKANTIANKVTSNMHGYPKMVKKGDMTPEMLQDRQPVLEDTVELMRAKEKYNLDISISEVVRNKYN